MSNEPTPDAGFSSPFPPELVAAVHADLHDPGPPSRPPASRESSQTPAGPADGHDAHGPAHRGDARAASPECALHEAVLADGEAARLLKDLDEVSAMLGALAPASDPGISFADDTPGDRHASGRTPADGLSGGGCSGEDFSGPGDADTSGDDVERMPELVAARLRRELLAAVPMDGGSPAGDADRNAPAAVRRSGSRSRKLLAAAAAVVAIGSAVGGSALWLSVDTDRAADSVTAHDAHPRGGTVAGNGRDITVHGQAGDGDTAAGRTDGAPPPGGLDPDGLLRMRGTDDLGPFAEPTALHQCLSANDLPPDAHILGAGPVRVDGRAGTLLLVPGPRPPMLTGLVVTERCGVDGDGLLLRTDLGAP
ncbi:hypothetical protein [Tomitella fengzijianii]|uniref:Uncharacterized protein n=1 Tax=Tomitella fengzijianii TaxID=2597660 RepID=A0A516X730_9ACTN|nr:hypothetical protein [Tomitella fengzijianii]QDQ98872.1 hypothetical protein FO059_17880 [Tomitella fengzijianii]